MTCEEYRAVRSCGVRPWNLSVAEQAAVVGHLRSCESCRTELEAKAAIAKRNVPFLKQVELEFLAAKGYSRIVADPEAKGIADGG